MVQKRLDQHLYTFRPSVYSKALSNPARMDIDPISDGLEKESKLSEVATKGAALPILRLAGCVELTDQNPVAFTYPSEIRRSDHNS